MNFGIINRIIVMGGGDRLINFVTVAQDYEIIVLSSKRLLEAELVTQCCSLEQFLEKRSIKYFNISSIKEFDIGSLITQRTLGISLGAPWIFNAEIIKKFCGKLINGHGARLPQNRGGGDYSWQIMNGLNLGYHLFHLVDQGIDTGDIIIYNEFLFPSFCKTPEDFKKYSIELEISFFEEFLLKIKELKDFEQYKQIEYLSTYFPRLSTEHHGFINWSWTAKQIERFICAFDDPYSGASTYCKGNLVRLKSVTLSENDGDFHPFMNGLVYRKTKEKIFIAASDASLIINNVSDIKGNNILDKIKIGDRFVTPQSKLDEALCSRISYGADSGKYINGKKV